MPDSRLFSLEKAREAFRRVVFAQVRISALNALLTEVGATTASITTVATATELYDFLRVLWARAGRTFCPNCGIFVERDTVDQVIDAAGKHVYPGLIALATNIGMNEIGSVPATDDDSERGGNQPDMRTAASIHGRPSTPGPAARWPARRQRTPDPLQFGTTSTAAQR